MITYYVVYAYVTFKTSIKKDLPSCECVFFSDNDCGFIRVRFTPIYFKKAIHSFIIYLFCSIYSNYFNINSFIQYHLVVQANT